MVAGIFIPGLKNGSFENSYFDSWDIDTSGGGVASINLAEIFHEQLAYCGDLARVSARKYQLLHRSLATGILGYVAFLATVLLL